MGNAIIRLQHQEVPVIETGVLITMQTELGFENSREMIERAVFEIADRLRRLELALVREDYSDMCQISGSLVAISEQIGLVVFADIAEDLARRVEIRDIPALHAVARRLLHVGEVTLFTAIQFPERAY